MKALHLIVCPFLLLTACSESQTNIASSESETEDLALYTFEEPHMGILFTLKIWARKDQLEELTLLKDKAFNRIAELNQSFSDYLPESEINDLARAPAEEPIPVSDDLLGIFVASQELWAETDGAFDISAGPLIRLWRRAKKNQGLPSPDQLASAKERTGFDLLVLDREKRTITKKRPDMLFDLGGIAKGYAADAALSILKESGFTRSLVAASGDIVVGDPPPGKKGWRIGIETLEINTDLESMPTVVLANKAISTSADTRRYFILEGVRYSHIVSTKTGLGLTERIGASVIAPTATASDSYATAVTLLGQKDGLQFIKNKREIECQIVALQDEKEVVIRSDGFPQSQEKDKEEAPVPAP